MKAGIEYGILPDYLMELYAEFTPIDDAARAVVTVARHFNAHYTVFHINNNKPFYFDRLVDAAHALHIDLKVVPDAEFTAALKETAKNTESSYVYEAFINDMDTNDKLMYDSNIRIENEFTVWYLEQLGFEWQEPDVDYLRKWVGYFVKLGYLNL